jgi:hypothetical protein
MPGDHRVWAYAAIGLRALHPTLPNLQSVDDRIRTVACQYRAEHSKIDSHLPLGYSHLGLPETCNCRSAPGAANLAANYWLTLVHFVTKFVEESEFLQAGSVLRRRHFSMCHGRR